MVVQGYSLDNVLVALQKLEKDTPIKIGRRSRRLAEFRVPNDCEKLEISVGLQPGYDFCGGDCAHVEVFVDGVRVGNQCIQNVGDIVTFEKAVFWYSRKKSFWGGEMRFASTADLFVGNVDKTAFTQSELEDVGKIRIKITPSSHQMAETEDSIPALEANGCNRAFRKWVHSDMMKGRQHMVAFANSRTEWTEEVPVCGARGNVTEMAWSYRVSEKVKIPWDSTSIQQEESILPMQNAVDLSRGMRATTVLSKEKGTKRRREDDEIQNNDANSRSFKKRKGDEDAGTNASNGAADIEMLLFSDDRQNMAPVTKKVPPKPAQLHSKGSTPPPAVTLIDSESGMNPHEVPRAGPDIMNLDSTAGGDQISQPGGSPSDLQHCTSRTEKGNSRTKDYQSSRTLTQFLEFKQKLKMEDVRERTLESEWLAESQFSDKTMVLMTQSLASLAQTSSDLAQNLMSYYQDLRQDMRQYRDQRISQVQKNTVKNRRARANMIKRERKIMDRYVAEAASQS